MREIVRKKALALSEKAYLVFMRLATRLSAQEGQSMTEYALIMALVAVAAVAALTTLGGNITSLFSSVAGKLAGSASSSG